MKSILGFTFSKQLFLFSLSITAVIELVKKYLFSDFEFGKWLVILMIIDLITGVTKAVRNNNAVTSWGLRRTAVKFIQYFSLLILVHVLTNLTIGDKAIQLFAWLNDVAYIYLICVEAISILENISNKELNLKFIIDKIKSISDSQTNSNNHEN